MGSVTLTVNADSHPLMRQFHKPTDEKRMVVILAPKRYQDWLNPVLDIEVFMQPYAAERLVAVLPKPGQTGLFG